MTPEELHIQLDQYVEQQQLLLNVTRQIASSVGLSETIPHILEGVHRAIAADGVRLLLTEASGRSRAYAVGPQADEMANADALVIDLVEKRGEIALSRNGDGAAAVDWSVLPPDVWGLIALPLVAHQTQHGVLWLGFQSPHVYGDGEHTFLSILAGQAAIAIANARSFEAARRRREWLAAILASTPDPVLVVDREMCLQLANPAAQDVFGISAGEAIGQPVEQVIAHQELLDLFREHDDETPRLLEYTAEDGRAFSPTISDMRTEAGDVAGWVLMLRDISHFKRLNDSMSNFLSTVSHDMRSPLTFMKGYLDMLGMVGDLNERQQGFVEKIATGVAQMADMVEKILDAGRLDPYTGSYELSREPFDVVEIVEKTMASLAEPAAKKNLEFTYYVSDDIPILNVDRNMLASAFTNLVENAVKYTPEGGQVHIEVAVTDNELVFQVSDNGYGISEDDQGKLFKRNVRIHRKEWKRVKGSGLGLFIVKNVAQRHGGDAWVRSASGEGSTFYISIPLEGANLIGGTGEG